MFEGVEDVSMRARGRVQYTAASRVYHKGGNNAAGNVTVLCKAHTIVCIACVRFKAVVGEKGFCIAVWRGGGQGLGVEARWGSRSGQRGSPQVVIRLTACWEGS